jgi:hypothetical protein
MVFLTTDSKLSFDDNYLYIRKVRQDSGQSYWLHSFFLLALFIAFQIQRTVNGERFAWIIILPALVWIFPHLERIYQWIFVNAWGSRIRLTSITEIRQLPAQNELETSLLLLLRNGRKKRLVFRTAENQWEKFVEELRVRTALTASATN